MTKRFWLKMGLLTSVLWLVGLIVYIWSPLKLEITSTQVIPTVMPTPTPNWTTKIIFESGADVKVIEIDRQIAVDLKIKCDTQIDATLGFVRSQDGQKLAYLSPQGKIFFYDLNTDTCEDLKLKADTKGPNSLALSPSSSKLAYVLDGLHIYSFKEAREENFFKFAGNAASPDVIVSSLQWNRYNTGVYFAATKDVSQVRLARVSEDLTWLVSLPNYKNMPAIFAVSPDETRVAVEENNNLVIKNILTGENVAIAAEKLPARIPKIVWVGEWIIFGEGNNIWGSFQNNPAKILTTGKPFTVNSAGTKIAYNYSYAEGKFDGIGIYDLIAGQDLKLLVYGLVWNWAW